MSVPVVYVSAACNHSRAILQLIERTGFADAYAFVNVDKAKQIPKFVDRVPLLYDGVNVITDSQLFDMFMSVTGQAAGSPSPMAPEIAPVDSAMGTGFGGSFSTLDGTNDNLGIQSAGSWLNSPQERIETPDSEPLPNAKVDKT
jgi:hypothetical protein